jgi:hypothetical protein
MYCDYFQGVSTVHTRWEDVYTGTGENAHEALDEALDDAAQDGWDVRSVKNEFDPESPDNVQNSIRANNPDLEDDDDTPDGVYYYVSIFVRGVPGGVEESADSGILKRLGKVAVAASLAAQFDIKVSDKGATIVKYKDRSDVADIPDTLRGVPVTSIGDRAFQHCTNLTSVTIPNSVTNIGHLAFYGCPSLSSVTIPNSVTSIGSSAFANCTRLTSVTIPNSVTSIGGAAFSHCTSLTSVTIPNSVTSIGDATFNNCTSLTSVTIPNSVTSIGGATFNNCTNLTSVTIPNSVTNIGYYAFYGCTRLTSVTIPNSVTNIGHSAFSDTTKVLRMGVEESKEPSRDVMAMLGKAAIQAGKKWLTVGESVSEGTMNSSHLFQAYLDTLESVDKASANEFRMEHKDELTEFQDGTIDGESLDHLVFDVLDPILSKYCLPYTYFGSHPGNGSDIGCWPHYEEMAWNSRNEHLTKFIAGTVEAIQFSEGRLPVGTNYVWIHNNESGVDSIWDVPRKKPLWHY